MAGSTKLEKYMPRIPAPAQKEGVISCETPLDGLSKKRNIVINSAVAAYAIGLNRRLRAFHLQAFRSPNERIATGQGPDGFERSVFADEEAKAQEDCHCGIVQCHWCSEFKK